MILLVCVTGCRYMPRLGLPSSHSRPPSPHHAAWPGVRDLGIIFGAQLRVGGAGSGHVGFLCIFTFKSSEHTASIKVNYASFVSSFCS